MDKENPRARLYYLFGTNQSPHGSTWLARLPVGIFAISVGLLGLAGAWRRAAAFGWEIAGDIALGLAWITGTIWVVSLILYALKCKRHPQSVKSEHLHPVQGSLQALLPLSVLLVVIQFNQPGQGVWLLLALLALGLHLAIALRVVTTLVTGQMPSNAITPALYLPVVGGGLVGAMALAALAYPGWAAMLFGTGLSGWALLEARILSKLFEGPMPEALRPTIGVELAPPAIATLAAAVVWPQLPADVLMIGLGVSMAPLIGVLARYRWWRNVPFSIGFWSFSFPLAALASAILEAIHRGHWPLWIGIAALLAATAVIAFLAIRTIILLVRGRFLPAQ